MPKMGTFKTTLGQRLKHLEDVKTLCFLTGKAQALVTGDRDLLVVAVEFEGVSSCPILSLDAFCKMHSLGIG